MMFLTATKKQLHWVAKYFMIVYDYHGQAQTEVSTHLRTICHPPDPKRLTCFLLQKQSRHTEAIGKENSAEDLLVSILTTAVFFSGLPYIVLTTAAKYSLGGPPVASRVCNHPPTPQMFSEVTNPSLPIYTA